MDNNAVLRWNDTIRDDGRTKELIILPEGDYNYTVTDFERSYYDGSDKVPPCPAANLVLEVITEKGAAIIKTRLFLVKSLEWKISAFFRSIGQKKIGEQLKPNWDAIVGAQGRAHFGQDVITDSYGKEKIFNSLKYFIDYNKNYFDDSTEQLSNLGFKYDSAHDRWDRFNPDAQLPY